MSRERQGRPSVLVVGGGLAGCEASWQLLRLGAAVDLREMRPAVMTPAHRTGELAELLCSNSLRSMRLENAGGVLKYELKAHDSLILRAAEASRVPAGFALAVDRQNFSRFIEEALLANPHFQLQRSEVQSLDPALFSNYDAVILATGPLTSPSLATAMSGWLGTDNLYFYDAKAPIVEAESLDLEAIYRASRYQADAVGDYLNCSLNEEEYRRFYEALVSAETSPLHNFESLRLFQGCQPLEEIARSGYDSLRFGPLKPVGLKLPDGTEPYAVLQLRQDNASGTQYNLTGCQTRLTYPEQDRVFRYIPALKDARFVSYGQMHRNIYINAPVSLTRAYRVQPAYADRILAGLDLAIVGQLSGVEGYIESTASGFLAAHELAERLGLSSDWPRFSRDRERAYEETMIGGLALHTERVSDDYQPAKANYGLLSPLSPDLRGQLRRQYRLPRQGRRGRRLLYACRALSHVYAPEELESIVRAELEEER